MPEQITAILLKESDIGVISLTTEAEQGFIGNLDTKHKLMGMQRYDTPEFARNWFYESIKTSEKNGWKLACVAKPNNWRLS